VKAVWLVLDFTCESFVVSLDRSGPPTQPFDMPRLPNISKYCVGAAPHHFWVIERVEHANRR
jgi:hypothetical protein